MVARAVRESVRESVGDEDARRKRRHADKE